MSQVTEATPAATRRVRLVAAGYAVVRGWLPAELAAEVQAMIDAHAAEVARAAEAPRKPGRRFTRPRTGPDPRG